VSDREAPPTATRENRTRWVSEGYGQLGQEPDLGMYLDHMVEVFREVRRVLRPDGVCWIGE
jgi:hypothetical protein